MVGCEKIKGINKNLSLKKFITNKLNMDEIPKLEDKKAMASIINKSISEKQKILDEVYNELFNGNY